MIPQIQADIHRPDGRVERGRRHVRGTTDVAGIDLKQQLGHGGVAGQGDGGDIVRVHLGLSHDFADDGIDGFRNHLVETVQPALFFGKDNPADHILTVADLAVELHHVRT